MDGDLGGGFWEERVVSATSRARKQGQRGAAERKLPAGTIKQSKQLRGWGTNRGGFHRLSQEPGISLKCGAAAGSEQG